MRTGGTGLFTFIYTHRAISAAWKSSNSVDEVEDFRVLVDDLERATVGSDALRYDLYALTNNTAYTFQVKATLVNGGSSLYSGVISATTLDRTAPDAPDTPRQLAVTGGFVQVSVHPSADTGGADLVSVTVIVRSVDSLTVVAHQSQSPENSDLPTYNIYGLDALTTYRISAFATNEGDQMSLEGAHLVITTTALQLPDPCPSPKVLETTGVTLLAV